ncbi:MAG: hypothetical protein FWD67_09125 [Betaproteobacteria bacterium]|nr:hypothetical protein [Betaproteobacteria bacterium]
MSLIRGAVEHLQLAFRDVADIGKTRCGLSGKQAVRNRAFELKSGVPFNPALHGA